MGWPSKLTDRELKRDSLLMSCTSPEELSAVVYSALENGIRSYSAVLPSPLPDL